MIHFSCPTCLKKLRTPEEMTGSKVRCPKCQQKLLVPPPVRSAAHNKTVLGKIREEGATLAPNSLSDVQKVEGTPSPFAVASSPPVLGFEKLAEPPEPEGNGNRGSSGEQYQTPVPLCTLFRVSCPHCQSPIQVEHRHLGNKVACGKCRQSIVLAAYADATVRTMMPVNEPIGRRISRKKLAAIAVIAGSIVFLCCTIALKFLGRSEERIGTGAARDRHSESRERNAPDAKQAEEPALSPNTQTQPTSELDPAVLDKMVKDYMAARLEDKPRFVMDPERVRPLMEAYASTVRGSKPRSITTRFVGKRASPVEWYLVQASGLTALGSRTSADFPFRRTSEGFKIDWEAFVGYNPTPLKVFMAERPDSAFVFRVECELADYYNFAFSGAKDTHLSVSLREYNPNSFAHGYVSKDSPDGKRIHQLLRDGQRHKLTLELRHVGPDGILIDRAGSSVVSITRLVSESWVLK